MMSTNQYELVFYGELVKGYDLKKAKANVAQLFKASEEQVARMFAGNRVVIRNKLDGETARKYLKAMQQRGAVCQIESMGAPGVTVDLSKIEKEPAVNESPVSNPAVTLPTTPVSTAPVAVSASVSDDGASSKGLPLAGKKVPEILAHSSLQLEPVGSRLSEENNEPVPEFHALDNVTILPVGSDMAEKKEALPPIIPDTSNISLKE